MPLTNKHKSFSILFILFMISALFFLGHYLSNSKENELFQRIRQSKADTDFTQYSKVLKDKVVLVKNHCVTINNCRLVFTGIEDKMIHLDLYLLELDPQYAYHQHISKAAARDKIRLGDAEYQLISVNKEILKLKITTVYKPF